MFRLTFFVTVAAIAAHVIAHGTPHSQEELLARRELNEITGRSLQARCGATLARRKYARMHKRSSLGLTPFNTRDTNDSVCILTPEVTQGPYHILGELVLQNITEDQAGIPLELDVHFFNIENCEPIPNVWVDGWSANATGIYSGFEQESVEANAGSVTYPPLPTPTGTGAYTDTDNPADWDFSAPTDNNNFLRGAWQADESGHLTVYTIVPGWYSGRAVHFHIKAYTEGNGSVAENGTFVAGSAIHTGQLFFPEEFLELVGNTTSYNTNKVERLANDNDTWYNYQNAWGYTADMDIALRDEGDITAGVVGSINLGLNLSFASPEAAHYWWGSNDTSNATQTVSAA